MIKFWGYYIILYYDDIILYYDDIIILYYDDIIIIKLKAIHFIFLQTNYLKKNYLIK